MHLRWWRTTAARYRAVGQPVRVTASLEPRPPGHICVPQPPGTTRSDLYEICIRGEAPIEIDRKLALVTGFVSSIRLEPPRSLQRWRQQFKERDRKTTAPEFILLGPRGGMVHPPLKLRPRANDHEHIRRADGSASIGTSTDLHSPHASFRLGFNVVDTTAPRGLAEPTVFLDGSINLYRDMDPTPMIDLLDGDLRRLMLNLEPFVRACEIWVQAAPQNEPAASLPATTVAI